MKEYNISFPKFFRDDPDFSKRCIANTAGKAKYACYLQFSEAYDMPFKEFLKIIKITKLTKIEPITETAFLVSGVGKVIL